MKHDLIRDITEFIFLTDPPEKADVIFIPGCAFAELPEKAAQLYHEGLAPLVLPSGRFSMQEDRFPGPATKSDRYTAVYGSECAFMTDVLVKNGVPRQAVLCEDQARYTQQNALLSRRVTDALCLDVRKALIVCQAFHARRCLGYWQIAFPRTQLLVCPVSTRGITRENWSYSPEGVRLVLGELERCGGQMRDDIARALRAGLLPPRE